MSPALAALTLAVGAGGGCSRVDSGELIGLDVSFAPTITTASDSLKLTVTFDHYMSQDIWATDWTNLQEARHFNFLPPSPVGSNGLLVIVGVEALDLMGSATTFPGMSTSVVIKPPDAGEPPKPPAPEAGVPDADAGVDVDLVEAGGTDANDDLASHPVDCDSGNAAEVGGGDVPPETTCSDYCLYFVPSCGGGFDDCFNTCSGLKWEIAPANSADPNTLICRQHQAQLAADPEYPGCASASWTGHGVCGTTCDVFCDAGRLDCPSISLFTDSGACRAQCLMYSTADLACRVTALINAGNNASTSAANCAQASIAAGGCH